jgi:hypothetical protein
VPIEHTPHGTLAELVTSINVISCVTRVQQRDSTRVIGISTKIRTALQSRDREVWALREFEGLSGLQHYCQAGSVRIYANITKMVIDIDISDEYHYKIS